MTGQTIDTIEFSPPYPLVKISGVATPVPDPDWITITIYGTGYRKHVRRSRIEGFGMKSAAVGGGRRVPYVEMNGQETIVMETEEELAQMLGASLAS